MSRWLATVSPERVERQALGPRGHHLRLRPRARPEASRLVLTQEERQLVAQWLTSRAERVRWSRLLAVSSQPMLAEDLLRRLLEAGWCEVELHAEAGMAEVDLQPYWVNWCDAYALRSLVDGPEVPAPAEVVALWRGWQPRQPQLARLAESLAANLHSSTLERRLKLAQALDDWLSAGRWGSERQFSVQALGRQKAFNEADRQWFAEFGIDLEACGVSRGTPHVFLSGPLTLWAGAERLVSANLLQAGVALPPEALLSVTALDGSVRAVRVVSSLSVFQQLTEEALPILTLWLPGHPHRRWQLALQHLLAALPLPVQVACDLDPRGVAMAWEVGQLVSAAGRSWQPWKMAAEDLTLAHGAQPLTSDDQRQLAALAGQALPAPLAGLVAALQERQLKVTQEALFG